MNVTDNYGDVKGLTNAGGTMVYSYSYDAFGNTLTDHANDTNPFRYSGEYLDDESGLIYLRARYYDSSLGRFVSEDPHWNPSNMIYGDEEEQKPQISTGIIEISAIEDPVKVNTPAYHFDNRLFKNGKDKDPDLKAILQSGNVYLYCMNNPLAWTDSSGEAVITNTYSGWQAIMKIAEFGIKCGINYGAVVAVIAEVAGGTATSGVGGVLVAVAQAGTVVSGAVQGSYNFSLFVAGVLQYASKGSLTVQTVTLGDKPSWADAFASVDIIN